MVLVSTILLEGTRSKISLDTGYRYKIARSFFFFFGRLLDVKQTEERELNILHGFSHYVQKSQNLGTISK